VNVLLLELIPHWLVGLAMGTAIHVEQDQQGATLEGLFDTASEPIIWDSISDRTSVSFREFSSLHIYINT
jgi:hypothetical protein